MWLINQNLNWKLYFLAWKTLFWSTQFSPQNAGNCILGLWNFKIFWESMPQDSPRGMGLTRPLLIQSGTLFKQLLATSIIIETPEQHCTEGKNLWLPLVKKYFPLLFSCTFSLFLFLFVVVLFFFCFFPLAQHLPAFIQESWNYFEECLVTGG